MIAMLEKIISWLKAHENDLQDIDYADDVELDFGETGLGICFITRGNKSCRYKRRVDSASAEGGSYS